MKLARSRWYGQQTLKEGGAAVSNTDAASSLIVWKCAGTGTYTYTAIGDGQLLCGGKWWYADAYDTTRFAC